MLSKAAEILGCLVAPPMVSTFLLLTIGDVAKPDPRAAGVPSDVSTKSGRCAETRSGPLSYLVAGW